jgi:hypothetical protein
VAATAAANGYEAFLALLNVVQTVALTYIAARWRGNGS